MMSEKDNTHNLNEEANTLDELSNRDMVSEPVAMYSSQPQAMEHLRHQGIETLMKIDDIDSLRILIPKIQRIYLYNTQNSKGSTNKERLLKSLDTISQYKDNWDDEGSPAIMPAIIDFVSDVVNNASDYLLEHWSIFPSNNGTLKIETHQPELNAGINIGEKEFSYYIHYGADEIYGKSSNTRKHLTNLLTQVYYGE